MDIMVQDADGEKFKLERPKKLDFYCMLIVPVAYLCVMVFWILYAQCRQRWARLKRVSDRRDGVDV